jgi:hypothetical protein
VSAQVVTVVFELCNAIASTAVKVLKQTVAKQTESRSVANKPLPNKQVIFKFISNTCIRNSTMPTSIILEASTRAVSRPHLRPHFRIYLACTLSTSLPAALTQPTPHTQPNYIHTHAPLPFLQLLVGRIVGERAEVQALKDGLSLAGHSGDTITELFINSYDRCSSRFDTSISRYILIRLLFRWRECRKKKSER